MIDKKLIAVIGVSIIILAAAFVGIFYKGSDLNIKLLEEKPKAIDTLATEQSVAQLADAMNKFSFELYKKLGFENNENIFFSPYSIFVALAMTYEGAQGETADEMEKVLNFQQNDDITLCSFGKIYNILNQENGYTINTANALWTMKNFSFLEEYLNFIDSYYMGKATDVDFSDAEGAAKIINDWVEENTNGKIKDLIKSSDIDAYTRLILTNAIYFKGFWETQFDPEDTYDNDFKINSEETISVPMMNIHETKFNYAETDDLQILELPYEGNDLSMIILLPKENNIPLAESELTPENLEEWRNSFSEIELDVSIPKFKMETEYDLKNYLIAMGLNYSFDPFEADFSGITGAPDLYIKKVAHKAFIEVNEEGSEAAAATGVIMNLKAMPDIKRFTADHPFIFLIQQKEIGNIIFMGKVVNPSE